MKITKEKFEEVYNKYLPNKFIKFAFKYFSKSTEKKDFWVNNSITYFLLSIFLFGFLGTILKLSDKIIGFSAISYSIILAILIIYLFTAVKLNNKRISKICKELGITKSYYNELVDKYY